MADPALRLPNFVIIGAPKSGTTALARYLEVHPEVFVAPEKELRYFDSGYANGPEWYAAYFKAVDAERAVGEATPSYLADPDVPGRMAQLIPDAKLIAILRNPIDRAYSQYWQVRRRGFETREFAEAVRDERTRGADDDFHRYLGIGGYLEQLQRFTSVYPREKLLVMLTEDLGAHPAAATAEVFRFLEVDDGFRPPNLGRVYNQSHSLRSKRLRRLMLRTRAWSVAPGLARRIDQLNRAEGEYPPMDRALRADLVESFAPSNAELAAWLGRDLSRWGS